MELCKAIQFRFLSAQLTKSERHQFHSQLLDLKPGVIESALFHYIKSEQVFEDVEAEYLNNSINKIILSRKKKPKPLPKLHKRTNLSLFFVSFVNFLYR
eukprot:340062_1